MARPLMLCQILLALLTLANARETFDEEVLVKDLGGGYVALHFNFVSRSPEYESSQPWSIQALLGAKLQGSCPVADSSRLILLTPLDTANAKSISSDVVDDARVQSVYPTSVLSNGPEKRMFFNPNVDIQPGLPLVSMTKYITGSGSTYGGIRVMLTSRATDFPLHVVFMDLVPWYTPAMFHSLQVHVRVMGSTEWKRTEPVKSHIVHSRPRERMGLIELVLLLPPGHEVTVSYQFRRLLLRWDEYPPDANHGFFLPAATLSYQIPKLVLGRLVHMTPAPDRQLTLPNWAHTYAQYFNTSTSDVQSRPGDGFVQVHSAVVIINMPTPDFSMPFNALCVACSIVALLFGAVHKSTAGAYMANPAATSVPKIIRVSKTLISRVKLLFNKPKPGSPDGAENSPLEKEKAD